MEDSSLKCNYTDEEINELAEWMNNLTIEEVIILKDYHQRLLQHVKDAYEVDCYVH